MWKFICYYIAAGAVDSPIFFFFVYSLLFANCVFFLVVHLAVTFLNSNFSVSAWMRHFHVSMLSLLLMSTAFSLSALAIERTHFLFSFHHHRHHHNRCFTFSEQRNENRQRITKTNLCFTDALNFLFCHCFSPSYSSLVGFVFFSFFGSFFLLCRLTTTTLVTCIFDCNSSKFDNAEWSSKIAKHRTIENNTHRISHRKCSKRRKYFIQYM